MKLKSNKQVVTINYSSCRVINKHTHLDGSPNNDYLGQMVYERHKNNEWLMCFIIAKHLDVLTEVTAMHHCNLS